MLLLTLLLAAPSIQPTPIEHPERLREVLGALGTPRRVRVTHLGDSHIAADLWTAPIRAGLQARFGDGGRGFVLAGRPWAGYWQDGVANRTEGRWDTAGLRGGVDDGWFGPGGCSMASADEEATLTVGLTDSPGDFTAVDLHYLRQPRGGCVEVRFDGRTITRVSTRGPWSAPGFARIEAEPSVRSVTLHPVGGSGEVRIFGASFDRRHGVTWDALGINGARAHRLLRGDPVGFAAGMRRLHPQLVVLSFGTNELFDGPEFNPVIYAADQDRVLRRLRQAVPTADCLITGPPDALRRRQPLEHIDGAYQIMRDAAAAHGCAFWDTRAAMGGPGAIREWRRAGWAGSDFVHLTREGYSQLGEALLAALLEAHAQR